MKSRSRYALFTILISASILLSACSHQATPTTASEQPTSAPIRLTATPAPTENASQPVTVPSVASPQTIASPKTGGRITYIETGGFYTLDPFQTPWFNLPQGAIYDGLVTTNLELSGYTGVLAKDWEISSDGLTLAFNLREDVVFHDGTKFDSAAAKWNLEKYLDPAWPHLINTTWVDYIDAFEIPDNHTLVIKFKKPYAPIFSDLNTTYMVSPTAYDRLGQDNFGREPVGTGPWMAKEIVENDHVLYTRNPDYKWGPSFYENKDAVYPDELYIKYIGDQSVSYASLETGEATIISLPTQFLAQALSNKDIMVSKGIDWSDWYLGFNTNTAPFDNKDFRKAIAYAIDRDEIVQAGFEGEAFTLYSSLAPSSWGYTDAQNEYGKTADEYNPEKARELLAGLDYADANGDHVLEKEGQAITFKLSFPMADETKRVAETIQAQLADVGLKVELFPMEAAVISEMLQKCQQELFLRPFGLFDASILSMVFDSKMVGTSNRNCWRDTKTDELIKAADTTVDPTQRADAVEALVYHLVDQRPHIPLWASYLYTASRVDLKGLKYDKAGNFYLQDAYLDR